MARSSRRFWRRLRAAAFLRRRKRRRGARRASWPLRLARWAAFAALALAALPVLAVAIGRFAAPPLTPPMALAALGGADLRQSWAPLDRISPLLVDAVIAAEDQRFCFHAGFDLTEIREALDDASNGGRLRGASTISQQAARSAYLWQERSWLRKAAEAYVTFWMELLWPKRRIMEVHLNVAEFGPGLYGAEAAAQDAFGVSAAALSAEQAARLAAVLPAPNGPRPESDEAADRAWEIQRAMRLVRRDGLDVCLRARRESRAR